jgi:membrane peptidoglycan carboxypeptidase
MLAALKRLCVLIGAGATFLVVSVLCGLLVAGLAIPFAAASGMSARAADRELNKLPTNLTLPPQAQRTTVLDVNGDVLAYFYDENRIYERLSGIAPIMRAAILSIEDHRFYQHGAFDPKGTVRAFLTNQTAGGTVQGGSSITQQYVKMVLVNEASLKGDQRAIEAAQEPTYERKIAELRYAIALEQQLTKDQILERYLNIAYFGDGAYGVESAARHYFGSSAASLTLPQAAMLAGLVQNPDSYNPVLHPETAIDRRDEVIRRMAELGEITQHQAAQAVQIGFDQDRVQKVLTGCVETRFPFLCDYVRRSLLDTPSLGRTADEREKMIDRGGLTIQTAIDPKTQEMAQRSVSKEVSAEDPLLSTMTMIEPGTGLIVAMAQSRPVMGDDLRQGETYYNYSVAQAMGGGQGFQAGSTFKTFTAAAALDDGTPINKQYQVKRTQDFSGKPFASCERRTKVSGNWKVTSPGLTGKMNMAKAIAWSVNGYFIQLELDTGMCDVTRMATALGAKSAVDSAPISSYDDKPSFTLGTVEVTPLSMAEAYATLASGGIHCKPIIISKITTRDGRGLSAPSADCKRVISADVANAVNRILSGVLNGGSAEQARLDDHRPQAGKTGTIEGSAAVWFVGYTPDIAGAAMISVDRTRSPFNKAKAGYRSEGLKRYVVPSTGRRLSGSGGGDAGPEIWKPAITEYLKGKPKTPFGAPPSTLVYGKKINFPDLRGLEPDEAIKKLERLGLTVQRSSRPDPTVPKGEFINFWPRSGKISQYGVVKAVYSSGKPAGGNAEDEPAQDGPAEDSPPERGHDRPVGR